MHRLCTIVCLSFLLLQDKPQNGYYLLKKEHTDEPLRTKEDVAAPLGIRLISDHCYKNESYVLNFFDTHSKRNDALTSTSTFNIKYKLQCTLTAAI